MKTRCLLDYERIAREKEHELNLLVKLTAPPAPPAQRKPLNIAVVLDRSGSMHGAKLQQARAAVRLLANHLGGEDLLSVVTFDDRVDVVLEPTAPKNKAPLCARIDRIEAGGSTNLSGGWNKGLELAGRHANPGRVNRVLLLTDGCANAGITEPGQLEALGAAARKDEGISTTTLGFGNDFEEDLLTRIARAAGGGFHFMETADDAPAVFREELEGLLALVAQNIEIDVEPSSAVVVAQQWTDHPQEVLDGCVRFRLGDAYAGEEKALLLQFAVPGMGRLGPRTVVRLTVRYAEIAGSALLSKKVTEEVRVNVTRSGEEADAPRVEVLRELALQLAARARRQAVRLADGGDPDGARKTLEEAAKDLASLPGAGAGRVREEIRELEDRAAAWDGTDYGTTRKMLCTDAFHLSRSDMNTLARARRRRRSSAEK